jgi:hypothetical protein
MSGKAPKRKGDGYERELAKYFNKLVFDNEDLVHRTYMLRPKEQKNFKYTNLLHKSEKT